MKLNSESPLSNVETCFNIYINVWVSVWAVHIICRLRATMNEPYSLASQRGLSKSSAGRLPLPFPVGQPGRVYFALFANNIASHEHTLLL